MRTVTSCVKPDGDGELLAAEEVLVVVEAVDHVVRVEGVRAVDAHVRRLGVEARGLRDVGQAVEGAGDVAPLDRQRLDLRLAQGRRHLGVDRVDLGQARLAAVTVTDSDAVVFGARVRRHAAVEVGSELEAGRSSLEVGVALGDADDVASRRSRARRIGPSPGHRSRPGPGSASRYSRRRPRHPRPGSVRGRRR